jgi:ketosteroid isomerase-like protein
MSPLPYEFPEDPSPQLEVIRKYYAFISAFDFDNLSTLVTDDFTQQMAPLSLGVPKKTKTDFLAYLRQYQANIESQHLDVSRVQMTHCANRQIA